jgi:hypothetical protein
MVAKKDSKPQYFKARMDLDEELAFLNEYTSQGDIPRIKLDFGDTEVRLGPAYCEEGNWFKLYATHWDLPIEGEKTTFRCAQTQDEPEECLFCTAAEMYKDVNPEMWKKWRAKPRYDFNALEVGAEDEGFKILSLPPSAAKDLLDACNKSAQRGVNPTDPEDGYSFIITKSKTGTKAYNVDYSFWANPMEGGPLKDWAVLDTLINLSEIFPAPTLKKQQELLQMDTRADQQEEQKSLPEPEEDVLEQIVSKDIEEDVIDAEVVEDTKPKVSPSDLLKARMEKQMGKSS